MKALNDRKTPINISISKKLLAKIEKDIEGKNRSKKILKCVRIGFQIEDIERRFRQLQEETAKLKAYINKERSKMLVVK